MHYLAIVYRLLIAFWTGGVALFTLVLTPTLFRSFDRDTAGTIVGTLFPGYFQTGLVCGVLALGCLLLTRDTHWLASTLVLLAMLVITMLQAFVIEPRSAAIKKEIPSFVTTPPDDPMRRQFKKLHAVSATGNLAVLAGGAVLIILL